MAAQDDFCLLKADEESSEDSDIQLVLLKVQSYEYLQVKNILKTSWKHSKKRRPKIRRVIKILRSVDSYEPYFNYRQTINGALSSEKHFEEGNERLLFHGTSRGCRVGEDDYALSCCTSPTCSLCKIVLTSFDVTLCGSHHKFSRFGKGIYTTTCSSSLFHLSPANANADHFEEADDYCSNTDPNAHSHVLILNRVVVGRPFRTPLNSKHLTEPPNGYHAVLGVPGVHLNYEETVIYNNDAIRPAYLVVYDFKPEIRLKDVVKLVFNTPLS